MVKGGVDMAVDMTISPWTRLIKLAPPGSTTVDMQMAADRYALTADVYAAAADMWEEAALAVDLSTDDAADVVPLEQREIRSVSQDGISVTYASDGLNGYGFSARSASAGKMMARARFLRSRAKGKSVLVHDPLYDPYRGTNNYIDPDVIIPVNEVTEL